MALLSVAEFRRIERQHVDGISSQRVVDLFRRKGERFSEATLRKYVQLGLLPKSRRIGQPGRHRGSSGRYPVSIVRQISDIKRLLEAGATLEEIRVSKVGLTGEVDALQRQTRQVLTRFEEAIKRQANRTRRSSLKKRLAEHRRVLARGARELSRLAVQVGRVP